LVSEAGKKDLNLNFGQFDSVNYSAISGLTDALKQALYEYRAPSAGEGVSLNDIANTSTALQTVDELRLIPGFTPALLDGEDTNRNGVLDPNENDGDASAPNDNADGRLDRGLRDFVTVYSQELNTSDAGEPRIFLNQGGQGLGELLQSIVEDDRYNQLVATIPPARPFQNVLDFYVRGGLQPDEFAQLHDRVSTQRSDTLSGRVDVYAASSDVLETLGALEAGDGDLIVSSRPRRESPAEPPGDFAWLIEAIGEATALAIAGNLTHRSLQFTADVVAVDAHGRGFVRMKYVLDVAPLIEGDADTPVVLHVQDLTALGWPLDPQILIDLRQGLPAEDVANRYGASAI
jgi:hypothetical protein